ELTFQEIIFQEATDDPDGDSLQAIIINNLAGNGIMTLAGEFLQPDIQISTDQIKFLKFKPDENWNGTTSFTWQAITNSALSQNQAWVNITVHPYADDIIIYDGFSPNGDNINDQWTIGNIGDYPENMVSIFNRFNILIYQQKNYDNEAIVWKGETNKHHFNQEHLAPDDIYYYVISLNNDEKVLKGAVTLKR
ncbi:MAG: gliding motility-associated C-terminal domain-containing protein, partial [Cyclobacteriaceae bacterium]